MGEGKLDILIVDDEDTMEELFMNHLSPHSLQIKFTNQVHKAISIVKKEKPRLAIVDLFLPELDGFDLAEEIFKQASDCHIVLMSGIYDFTEKHLKNLGIEDFLKKPIDFGKLDAILNKHGLI